MTMRPLSGIFGAAILAVIPVLYFPTLTSAQTIADPAQAELALEPIGGFTDLGNVRILTTARCPEQSTSIIARITGGGFKPDTNVIGNTSIDLVQPMPDRTGYVVPIFADWEYLASAHDAKTPLSGRATLTLLCADTDLERIDARMEGAVEFASNAGKKPTYLQDGGPRIATGIPGVPAPGNGGVPKDAPTAPPVPLNAEGQYVGGQAAPGQVSTDQAVNSGSSDVKSGDSASSDTTPNVNGASMAASKAHEDSGPSVGLLLALGAAAVLLAFGAYVFMRRPGPDDTAPF